MTAATTTTADVDLVGAVRSLLATVPAEHHRHVLVVIDDDGPRLEQRGAWIVWARCNAIPSLARQVAGWRRRDAVPVFVVGDDVAELRGFAVTPDQGGTTR